MACGRVALVTDGRMSGASGKSRQPSMRRRAIDGNPIARLRNGDIIALTPKQVF
jgi:dihydroxyacid dehydratase/phosphogluconate dehydratase